MAASFPTRIERSGSIELLPQRQPRVLVHALVALIITAGGVRHPASAAPGPSQRASSVAPRSVRNGLPIVNADSLPQLDITKLPWDPDGKRVVARINGRRITEGMLRAELQRAQNQNVVSDESPSPRLVGGLVEPVLNNLILNQLILDFAEKHGIRVREEDIDAWIRSENAKLPPGRKLEDKAIECGETKDELREEVRVRLLHDRVTQRIGAHVQPATPEQLKAFVDAHPGAISSTTTIRASHIVIGCKSDATSQSVENARRLVLSIQAEIESGLDFTSAALRYSQDAGTRSAGGDLGYFHQGHMYPEFDRVAFSLKPGQVSQIVRTPVGFHLIEVTDRQSDNSQEIYMLFERKKAFSDWHGRALKSARIEKYL